MAKTSYLRFNPDTREIELEGSEEFIKEYFEKLEQMLPQTAAGEYKALPVATIAPEKAAGAKKKTKKEVPASRKAAKASPKKAARKKTQDVTFIDQVVELIQRSTKGITTAELQEKTGLTRKQIWAIASRAAKIGKIKKSKRGTYLPV